MDVLRLLASFQMVNGHTLDAVMLESIKQGPLFERYNFIRSLVSVAFLTVAGIAFHLSTLARFERHRASPGAVRRRFRRAAAIILIAYAMTLPWGLLSDDPALHDDAWFYFFRVEILRCIGAGLLVLELMTLLARRPAHVVVASAILAATAFAAAPWTDTLLARGEPHPFLNWFSHRGGSMFPIVPWTGYIFAGLVIGAWCLPEAGRTPFPVIVRRLLATTAVLTALAMASDLIPASLLPTAMDGAADPRVSLDKLATVTGLILVLAVVCQPIRSLSRLPRLLATETLAIYVIHIVLLFYPMISIADRVGRGTLTLPVALGVSAFMIVLTTLLTLLWHRAKSWWAQRRTARDGAPSRPRAVVSASD